MYNVYANYNLLLRYNVYVEILYNNNAIYFPIQLYTIQYNSTLSARINLCRVPLKVAILILM